MVTEQELSRIMQCAPPRARRWADPLNAAMREWGISTPRRQAHFLAQVGHESLSLSKTEEGMSYSLERLLEVFRKRIPANQAARYVRNPQALGNHVYANRNGNGDEASGDGYRYRGRGPAQLTGRGNYARIGTLLGLPLVDQPDLVLNVEIGARAAAAWWKDNGLNPLADANDTVGVSKRINLGSATSKATPEGLPDRVARTERALAILRG